MADLVIALLQVLTMFCHYPNFLRPVFLGQSHLLKIEAAGTAAYSNDRAFSPWR